MWLRVKFWQTKHVAVCSFISLNYFRLLKINSYVARLKIKYKQSQNYIQLKQLDLLPFEKADDISQKITTYLFIVFLELYEQVYNSKIANGERSFKRQLTFLLYIVVLVITS